MSSVFSCTNKYICTESPEDALKILEGLAQMVKFDLTVSLLPQDDLDSISEILEKLLASSCCGSVAALKAKYKI